MKLPKGYCVFGNCDVKDGDKTEIEFKGVKYTAVSGENYFSDIDSAMKSLKDIPVEKLRGIPYIPETPTLLLCPGEYNLNNIVIYTDVTFIGNHVGVSPNLFNDKDKKGCPRKNPLWEDDLTVIKGDWWADWIYCWIPECKKIVFDGIALYGMRFDDARLNAEDLSLVFRNISFIKQVSTMYCTFGFQPLNKGSREIVFENVRYEGVDALDSTESAFINPYSDRLIIKDSVFSNTDKYLGFTDWQRKKGCVADNASPRTDIIIENCYFGDLYSRQPISTAYRLRDRDFEAWDEIRFGKFSRAILEYYYEDYYSYGRDGTEKYIKNGSAPDLYLQIKDSIFYNASLKNNPVFSIDLYKDKTHVNIENCSFTDSRGNNSPIVEKRRGDKYVSFKNCKISGFACEQETRKNEKEAEVVDRHVKVDNIIAEKQIDRKYGGLKAFFGDMHMHSNSGGCSDGSRTLAEWKDKMISMNLDFVAPVDHYQIRQMYLDEFDNNIFLCGTEPDGWITDLKKASNNNFHYGMYFPDKETAFQMFKDFPEFNFQGDGINGHFDEPKFTKKRFNELSEYIYDHGGFITHMHPKQIMRSECIEDYYLGNHIRIETLYGVPENFLSYANTKVWLELLSIGKKVIATAGSDSHELCSNRCLNVVYSERLDNRSICKKVHDGMITAGAYGIKMTIGDVAMGGTVKYSEGLILAVAVGDLFVEEKKRMNKYELRVYSDRGLCYKEKIGDGYDLCVGLKMEKRKFYRAEIYNLTNGYTEALGNPIWIE